MYINLCFSIYSQASCLLGSTDAVRRVPHRSLTRGTATDAAACESVLRLSFFYFLFFLFIYFLFLRILTDSALIRADLASICVDSGRFALNQSDSARIGLYQPTVEIGLESCQNS